MSLGPEGVRKAAGQPGGLPIPRLVTTTSLCGRERLKLQDTHAARQGLRYLPDETRLSRSKYDKATLNVAVFVNDSTQGWEDIRDGLGLVENQGRGGARFYLKARSLGEQRPRPRLLEVTIGEVGKRCSGQRRLTDLTWAQDQQGRKLPCQITKSVIAGTRKHNLYILTATEDLQVMSGDRQGVRASASLTPGGCRLIISSPWLRASY